MNEGTYDGNVSVYNIKETYKQPLYLSESVKGKHGECVCEVIFNFLYTFYFKNFFQIKWGLDMLDGELNFYSVSVDGKILHWILMPNILAVIPIITLFIKRSVAPGPDGTEMQLKSCGTCLSFHPQDPQIFLVGTEEGLICKCSTAYSSTYLITYDAHYLSVNRIDFNRFDSNIFISCSHDWRVKIWEDMRSEPLFIFDLGSCVGDVKWAPYSSTVFAAVTTEGKVLVFDINVSKFNPICVQQIVPKRKNKLTRIAFNEKLPFIIVGDEK